MLKQASLIHVYSEAIIDTPKRQKCNYVLLNKSISMKEPNLMKNCTLNLSSTAMLTAVSMSTLFESRYTSKGRYNIGNIYKTASMSMVALFESRYIH